MMERLHDSLNRISHEEEGELLLRIGTIFLACLDEGWPPEHIVRMISMWVSDFRACQRILSGQEEYDLIDEDIIIFPLLDPSIEH